MADDNTERNVKQGKAPPACPGRTPWVLLAAAALLLAVGGVWHCLLVRWAYQLRVTRTEFRQQQQLALLQKEELAALEDRLAALDCALRERRNEIGEAVREQGKLNSCLAQFRAQTRDVESKLAGLRADVETVDADLVRRRAELSALNTEIRERTAIRDAVLDDYKGEIARLRAERAAAEDARNASRSELAQLTQKVSEKEEEYDLLRKRVKPYTEKYARQKVLENSIKALTRKRSQLTAELNRMVSAHGVLQEHLRELGARARKQGLLPGEQRK